VGSLPVSLCLLLVTPQVDKAQDGTVTQRELTGVRYVPLSASPPSQCALVNSGNAALRQRSDSLLTLIASLPWCPGAADLKSQLRGA